MFGIEIQDEEELLFNVNFYCCNDLLMICHSMTTIQLGTGKGEKKKEKKGKKGKYHKN